jgi:hypothetical protein
MRKLAQTKTTANNKRVDRSTIFTSRQGLARHEGEVRRLKRENEIC